MFNILGIMTPICNHIVDRYIKCKQKYDNYEDIHGNCIWLFNLLKKCANNSPDDDD